MWRITRGTIARAVNSTVQRVNRTTTRLLTRTHAQHNTICAIHQRTCWQHTAHSSASNPPPPPPPSSSPSSSPPPPLPSSAASDADVRSVFEFDNSAAATALHGVHVRLNEIGINAINHRKKMMEEGTNQHTPSAPPLSPVAAILTHFNPAHLTDAVSQTDTHSYPDPRLPCHPSSLLSLPVLNLLKGSLHSLSFAKMVQRASVLSASAGQTWRIVPEWDFADELAIATSNRHPNWNKQQDAWAKSSGTMNEDNNGATNSAAAASTATQQEPFTKHQIDANLTDFIHSSQLHQCPALVETILRTQKKYFDLAATLLEKNKRDAAHSTHHHHPHLQHHAVESTKDLRKKLTAVWDIREPAMLRILVDQFVSFMGEPMESTGESAATTPPTDDDDSLEATIARASRQQQRGPGASSKLDSLLKTRAGRLRFDPSLAALSNLSAPHEWYPLARSIPRKFIIHVGPTNSGKTYHAMQRMMAAKSGLYAGPLRLLAWEVYDKLCKAGVPCNLRTGQETEDNPLAHHTSSTVEMANTNTIIDVAVIDECQMISSADRGSSWTRALLGIPAYEIHICGDPSMVEIVEELAAITQEEVEVREYQRLTPLVISPPLRRGIRDVKKGDCIVAFSRKELYRLKHDIEHELGLKACIIYGSLPPETRRNQAELFNAPDSEYDVLVASDAIGMGLNLNISRIIFAKMSKFDGTAMRPLTPSETMQIAGRAGRFNTNKAKLAADAESGKSITTMSEAAESNQGYATTLNPDEHAYLQWAMQQKLVPIERAGLAPTFEQLEELHALRPKETLSNLVTYFAHYAKLDSMYFSIDMESLKAISESVEHVEFDSIATRFHFCQAPAKIDLGIVRSALIRFAELFAKGECVYLKSFKVPQMSLPTSDTSMMLMETLYSILDMYVWLGLRFGEEIFVDTEKAKVVREK